MRAKVPINVMMTSGKVIHLENEGHDKFNKNSRTYNYYKVSKKNTLGLSHFIACRPDVSSRP